MKNKEDEYLACFLGPKSENANILEEVLLVVLRDYIHWRRNYFPGDKILINKDIQKDFGEMHNKFYQKIDEMLAELRRNFPFYSPRYIGHMLSDTTMPSLIGYFAGMLYNPNNVTPEAAPVTTHFEIDACNSILKMIGYNPPPQPSLDKIKKDKYLKDLSTEFGWAHITSGGTIANIEALWIARTIRYFPLAIKEISEHENLSISIKFKVNTEKEQEKKITKDIREIENRELLLMNPSKSIYLLEKYVKAIMQKYGFESVETANKEAWKKINESRYSVDKGMGKLFSEFSPVIFTSGSAHYSIKKAADILGIGKENVIPIKMDSLFRLDVNDLEEKILFHSKEGKIPLAVIAIAGTTEEGAVDPVHEILELREKLEKDHKISFWLHIDAAWGGYIKSLFCIEPGDLIKKISPEISKNLNLDLSSNYEINDFNDVLFKFLEDKVIEGIFEDNPALNLEEIANSNGNLNRSIIEFNENKSKTKIKIKDDFKLNIINLIERFKKNLDEFKKKEANKMQEMDPLERRFIKKFKYTLKKDGELEKPMMKVVGILCDNTKKKENSFTIYLEENNLNSLVAIIESAYVDRFLREIKGLKIYLKDWNERLNANVRNKDYGNYRDNLKKLFEDKLIGTYYQDLKNFNNRYLGSDKIEEAIRETVGDYVKEDVILNINFKGKEFQKKININWNSESIYKSFMKLHEADSLTVDPHKMGYLPYPCGVVAFKSDRVRYFILQSAPYITSVQQNILSYQPPKHIEGDEKEPNKEKIGIESFARFILEGSKPGASACALWLSTQIISLTIKNHGSIIRSSLIAARELYEGLIFTNKVSAEINCPEHIKFIPLTCANKDETSKVFPSPGDTNIVTFVIKETNSFSIKDMNNLTKRVYEEFTILEELGEREYSYSQPFFLSLTVFSEESYSFDTLKSFFTLCDLMTKKSEEEVKEEYKKSGLTVLRATVMNPYLLPTEKHTSQNLANEFISILMEAAYKKLEEINKERADINNLRKDIIKILKEILKGKLANSLK